jgi:hypothetical protein
LDDRPALGFGLGLARISWATGAMSPSPNSTKLTTSRSGSSSDQEK